VAREAAARPAEPVDDDMCLHTWMKKQGLWTEADDAIIAARYGPEILIGHRYCCIERPWRSARWTPASSRSSAPRPA
jgi:hypothetical protein